MTDQEAENVAASVRHLLMQRGIDAREWERRAAQWQGVADRLRAQRDELLLAISAANRECDDLQRQLDERERNNANLQEEIAELQAANDRASAV